MEKNVKFQVDESVKDVKQSEVLSMAIYLICDMACYDERLNNAIVNLNLCDSIVRDTKDCKIDDYKPFQYIDYTYEKKLFRNKKIDYIFNAELNNAIVYMRVTNQKPSLGTFRNEFYNFYCRNLYNILCGVSFNNLIFKASISTTDEYLDDPIVTNKDRVFHDIFVYLNDDLKSVTVKDAYYHIQYQGEIGYFSSPAGQNEKTIPLYQNTLEILNDVKYNLLHEDQEELDCYEYVLDDE